MVIWVRSCMWLESLPQTRLFKEQLNVGPSSFRPPFKKTYISLKHTYSGRTLTEYHPRHSSLIPNPRGSSESTPNTTNEYSTSVIMKNSEQIQGPCGNLARLRRVFVGGTDLGDGAWGLFYKACCLALM